MTTPITTPAPPPVVSPSIEIAIINESTVLSDSAVSAIVPALQQQVTRDFAPIWNNDATLQFIAKGQTPPPKAWQLVVLDTSDQAGALGYHDLTPQAQPLGKVFAKSDLDYKLSWSVTISHELLEMLADPYINTCIQVYDQQNNMTLYAYENCLTGDTLISLMDGTEAYIKDLIGVEEFWVYSISEDGYICPGKAHSVRKTKIHAPILAIELDNGELIKCTPDHKFMLRDGSYLEAKYLTAGASLMPLYRRQEKLPGVKKSYEQIAHPATNEWHWTHRVVAPECPSGSVRHHKDFNRLNNSPDNLVIMEWLDHQKLHQEQFAINSKNGVYKGPKNFSAETRKVAGERGREYLIAYNKSEKHRKQAGKSGKNVFHMLWQDPQFRKEAIARAKEQVKKIPEDKRLKGLDLYHADRKRVTAAQQKRLKDHWSEDRSSQQRDIAYKFLHTSESIEKAKKTWTPKRREEAADRMRSYKASFSSEDWSLKSKKSTHKRWHINRQLIKEDCIFCQQDQSVSMEVAPYNHKVVSVFFIGYEDVYDLTVDDYHNFALSAGVFVHNCDAVEDDQFGYQIDGVLVSDFVSPQWFIPGAPGPYDFQGHVKQPLELLSGGYIGVWTAGQGWTQKTAQDAPLSYRSRPQVGSRRERRRTPRQHWLLSE